MPQDACDHESSYTCHAVVPILEIGIEYSVGKVHHALFVGTVRKSKDVS